MDAETSIQGLIQKAYDNLNASDAGAALLALEEALRLDFEHPEVVYALKCVNWWTDRTKSLGDIHSPYDRGGFILSQWNAFYTFLDRIGPGYERCIFAVRRYVFSAALLAFQDILGEGINEHDPGLLLQVGRCYKGVGNFDLALKYLEQAARFRREDGETLSHLADVNALLGETRAAKALFREAFFTDPQSIDLRSLDSELIRLLADRVRDLGYKSPELEEWIPIYGALYGVFSVRRELKQVELGRLKQAIFSLENEVRSRTESKALTLPRLINRYFWLLDHYITAGEDPVLIEETMLKIKVLDPAIYELYRR
ncbi:tetratricopeptide repeat protein [Breznakiella homolactica]|nr:tetratricopeptide repeat protein [Breznakiella homolactica]